MKNSKRIRLSILVGILIISNKSIYAEDGIIENSNNIETKSLVENEIEKEIEKHINYEIYNKDNIMSKNPKIEGKVRNCNVIKVKIGTESFVKNLDSNENEWNEFFIEVPLEKVDSLEIEFSNEFNTIKKENIKIEDDIKLLSNITDETKEIKVKCKQNIKSVYALINDVEYKGEVLDINSNTFKIALPNLKEQKNIILVGINEDEEKIEMTAIIKKVTPQKVISQKDNEDKKEQSIKKYKNRLNLKIIELNDKSSKIKGETLPNSKVFVNINSIEYNTKSNSKGHFEIDLFVKRKADTKVIFKVINENEESYEKEKTFIKYIKDETAPKKPYVLGVIRENDTYIKGKTESYSDIIVSIKTPTHIVNKNFISVRKTPSLKGFNKIGRLLKNEKIFVLEENSDWSKIEYKESIGYVRTNEIKKVNESKEFIYKDKANYIGEYEVKIDKHTQGSRVRIQSKDSYENISKETIIDIQK